MPNNGIKKAVENTWVRLGTVLLLGTGAGAGGTTLWAQPRSDQEIRDLAKDEVQAESRVIQGELNHIKEDVQEIKEDVDKMDGKLDQLLARQP